MTINYSEADSSTWAPGFLALLTTLPDERERATIILNSLPHHLLIATDGDALIGGVLYTRANVRGQARANVEQLVVTPEFHGRGIGRSLMQHAERHALTRGLSGMQVNIVAENAPARALYDALGYRPVERRVTMWKELRAEDADAAHANLAIVNSWTDDVWNNGNLALIPQLLTDPSLRHDPGKAPRPTTVAENTERIASFRQRIPDIRFTNDDLLTEADRVVARFTVTGTDPESHEPFAFSGIQIFRLQDGKIAEVWSSEVAIGRWND